MKSTLDKLSKVDLSKLKEIDAKLELEVVYLIQ